MEKYIYPYRHSNGYRSILEATNINDARDWLSAYPGTVFCRIEAQGDFQFLYGRKDFGNIVDQYLSDNENFVA